MKYTLRFKTIVLLALFTLILSATALTVSSSIISSIINSEYCRSADELARTVAAVLDGNQVERLSRKAQEIYHATENKVLSDEWGSPEFNEYIDRFSSLEQDADFLSLREQLVRFQDQNNVECIYLGWMSAEDEIYMYICDADPEEPCPPGCLDHTEEVDYTQLARGEYQYPAYITNTEEYGWLVTSNMPIFSPDGEMVAHCGVDISMDMIRAKQKEYTVLTGLLLLAVSLVISMIGILLVNRVLVKPLKILADAALNYCEENGEELKHGFEQIRISNRDEIGDLADSMKQMERDINDYYTNLFAAKQEIVATREQAQKMNEMANKDALTNVRNKRAYDVEASRLETAVKNGDKEFGIAIVDLNYLKKINDRYGHEMGDKAIQKICSIVCRIFRHSPVFRYGGDEFAIILRHHDLMHIERLIGEFKGELDALSRDDTLEPWEQVSAAIGFARYDESVDGGIGDVFKRADDAMYVDKQAMKVVRED
ncbi:MAG: diguanylate cyclase [Lachnospiraceae bacterium]|nr:diguanylate cyclase [Lachnospiraceae bacterium]